MYLLFFLSIKEQVINSLRPVGKCNPACYLPSVIQISMTWLDIRPDCIFQQGLTNITTCCACTGHCSTHARHRWRPRVLIKLHVQKNTIRIVPHRLLSYTFDNTQSCKQHIPFNPNGACGLFGQYKMMQKTE